MKKKIIFPVLLFISYFLQASFVKHLPFELTQPDGTIVNCFITGDEFNRHVHDENGYTIIQSNADGFYYFAIREGDELRPSKLRAESDNPASLGIKPWLLIPVRSTRDEFPEMNFSIQRSTMQKAPAISRGTLSNIVIYVRFKDDPEFTKSREDFSKILESPTPSTPSLKHYFEEISYGKFSIQSYQYPLCDSSVTVSYEDIQPRAYYRPYNETTNTIGYVNDGGDREQALIQRAINAVSSQISPTINIDVDNNNYVDNVTIVIKGNADGWGNLLWPHKWSLFKNATYINGKRVGNYIFITENHYNVKTMCHEMFHVVGAPDLYHYTGNGIDPAGVWDLMQNGGGHPTAYMKWKYSGQQWISNIPEITESGEYTLNPLSSAENNCFKIKSPFSTNEYFVVEYRRRAGLYESTLPQGGLIITRINSRYNGNAPGPPDEVYVCRPNGNIFSNGSLNLAAFSNAYSRTVFNNTSNPQALLYDLIESGIDISDIRVSGSTMKFRVKITEPALSKSSWNFTANSSESQAGNHSPNNVKTDNLSRIWHTQWSGSAPGFPHWIQLDMGEQANIKGIKCIPRQDGENGRIKDYDVLVSTDARIWRNVASGTFRNSKDEQLVTFPEIRCRFVRLFAKSEVNGKSFASLAEFDVITHNNLLPRNKWTLLNSSSFETGFEPHRAFDSIGNTIWHSKYSSPAAKFPHEISIDMKDTCSIDGLFVLPRQDASTNGMIADYEFYSSLDGNTWTLLDHGKWSNSKSAKITEFTKTVCRYIKLVALSEVSSGSIASIAELAVYGTKSNDVTAPMPPSNFKIQTQTGDSITLVWDTDNSDRTLLYYRIETNDTLFNYIYNNQLKVKIDSTQNQIFSLRAVDGSGNISDEATTSYFVTSNPNIHYTETPLITSSHREIRIDRAGYDAEILVYNAIGQLISSLSAPYEPIVITHNNSGIGLVVIKQKNKTEYRSKVLLY
jgi:M6 family metalloprotease-like protein